MHAFFVIEESDPGVERSGSTRARISALRCERYHGYVAAQSVIGLFSGENDFDQPTRLYPERRAPAFEKTVLLYKMDIQIGPSYLCIRWNVTDSCYSF